MESLLIEDTIPQIAEYLSPGDFNSLKRTCSVYNKILSTIEFYDTKITGMAKMYIVMPLFKLQKIVTFDEIGIRFLLIRYSRKKDIDVLRFIMSIITPLIDNQLALDILHLQNKYDYCINCKVKHDIIKINVDMVVDEFLCKLSSLTKCICSMDFNSIKLTPGSYPNVEWFVKCNVNNLPNKIQLIKDFNLPITILVDYKLDNEPEDFWRDLIQLDKERNLISPGGWKVLSRYAKNFPLDFVKTHDHRWFLNTMLVYHSDFDGVLELMTYFNETFSKDLTDDQVVKLINRGCSPLSLSRMFISSYIGDPPITLIAKCHNRKLTLRDVTTSINVTWSMKKVVAWLGFNKELIQFLEQNEIPFPFDADLEPGSELDNDFIRSNIDCAWYAHSLSKCEAFDWQIALDYPIHQSWLWDNFKYK